MLNKSRGFSLVETVISVAIMGIVIVTVLGVFVAGNNAIKKGRYRTAGVNIAEKKIAEIRNLLITYPHVNTDMRSNINSSTISGTIDHIEPSSGQLIVWHDPVASMTAFGIYGLENISTTGDYEFAIKLEDYVDSSTTTIFNLKLVTVTIYWIDPVSGRQKITKMSSLIARE
ncbi:MAG: type II secretion system protein [Candidatus Eremiobacterota bacterium]